MKTHLFLAASAIGVLTSMAGCSAVPQAALDQANNGSALMMSLQAELQNFKKNEAAIMQARLAGVREQQQSLAGFKRDSDFDDRVNAAAGVSGNSVLFKTLTDLEESRKTDQKALDAKIADIQKTYDGLLSTLPDPASQITATRDLMVKLGEQLTTKEQLNILADFAKDLKNSYDTEKKAIDDAAKQVAPSMPAPPPPSSS